MKFFLKLTHKNEEYRRGGRRCQDNFLKRGLEKKDHKNGIEKKSNQNIT
jgi:hypothetical protein